MIFQCYFYYSLSWFHVPHWLRGFFFFAASNFKPSGIPFSVVEYDFSVLFVLFFVMFSHASLAEWFLFFAASTLECFLFALSFLFMDATVAPDKEVDSLILELQLLSLSL